MYCSARLYLFSSGVWAIDVCCYRRKKSSPRDIEWILRRRFLISNNFLFIENEWQNRKFGTRKKILRDFSHSSTSHRNISTPIYQLNLLPPTMAGLEQSLFQLKFTAKQLNRQATKASKEELQEKAKIKKALSQGNNDIAQLYAQNAIRKSNERINLLRLASRIDAVASRVQTAVTMRSVTGNMTQVIRGMDKALQTMNLERISLVMDKFETQFEDLDASTNYYETTTNNVNALTTPQDQVDELLNQVADEAGIEMKQGLNATKVEITSPVAPNSISEEKEDKLAERLRALRN
ncbi:charged multivesicular body protein 1 [Candida albicans P37037]|nr:charged multivesicular body protein 1 [Candida albicans P37037]